MITERFTQMRLRYRLSNQGAVFYKEFSSLFWLCFTMMVTTTCSFYAQQTLKSFASAVNWNRFKGLGNDQWYCRLLRRRSLGSSRNDVSSSRSLGLLERFFEWSRDVTWVRCMTIQKSLRTLKGLDVFNFKTNVDDLLLPLLLPLFETWNYIRGCTIVVY